MHLAFALADQEKPVGDTSVTPINADVTGSKEANAAAPDASLSFLFWGAVVVLPVIAVYTIAVYWLFRGKLKR